MKNAARSFPLFFSFCLFVASLYAFMLEVAPYSGNLATPKGRFEFLERGSVGQSLSIRGQRLLLSDCLEAMGGVTGMAQPSERRVAMLNECQSFAIKATASTPSFALAWYIGAFASAELKQFSSFNLQLAGAQKTARNEQWLAQLRVNLAENYRDFLNSETLEGNDADLKLLVQSRIGVASIATRYVDKKEFRERITEIVESLSEEEQIRFVAYVRNAARQLASQREVAQ